jgi:hypothetical protein
MNAEMNQPKRKRSILKTFLWIIAVFFILLSIGGIFLYNNFNRLLSDALMKSFNSGIISEVYELKFKGLNVNPLLGNIKVHDVELHPREKPLKDYPYINSSFQLTTKKILLTKVEIYTLLKENVLKLEQIKIAEPEIQLKIANVIPIFLPFKEATVNPDTVQQKNKKQIEAFYLKKFDLVNASFHVQNSAKQRDLAVRRVNISLSDLNLDQHPGKDLFKYGNINIFLGEITGSLQKDKIRYINLKDCKLNIDSLEIQKTLDTFIYKLSDFSLGLKEFDLQTADSISHLLFQSFDLSYKDKSLSINNFSYKPDISEEAMQKRFEFRKAQYSGSVGALKMNGINFDSLLYKNKLFVDEITLDSVSTSIFVDKTKPKAVKRSPKYLGQSIKGISLPLWIKKLHATNVNLLNRERNIDSTFAIANINRGTLNVSNVTNINTGKILSVQLNAYLENKAPFSLKLGFDYLQPKFSIDGSFEEFNLTDLNSLIGSYTPAKIKKGTVDEISFSGNAYDTNASGTMKFLYHDLDVDLELKEKAKWKSSVLAFAANTVVASANPASEKYPPRIVQYDFERDTTKSFISITIKSVLTGLKESVLMSKENRKAYKEEKKKFKEEQRNKN